MQPIRELDQLATDLSWDTHRLLLILVKKKRKRFDYRADDRLKARLRLMFRRRLETPLGPVETVEEVLPQLIADIRSIQEEFIASDEGFMSIFRQLVEKVRGEMREIVRIPELSPNGAPDPNLQQRAASRFKKIFFAQLILFFSA